MRHLHLLHHRLAEKGVLSLEFVTEANVVALWAQSLNGMFMQNVLLYNQCGKGLLVKQKAHNSLYLDPYLVSSSTIVIEIGSDQWFNWKKPRTRVWLVWVARMTVSAVKPVKTRCHKVKLGTSPTRCSPHRTKNNRWLSVLEHTSWGLWRDQLNNRCFCSLFWNKSTLQVHSISY